MTISERSNWRVAAGTAVLLPALLLGLAGCGGGSNNDYFEAGGNTGGSTGGSSGGGSTGGGSTGGGTSTPDTVTIGANIGGSFRQGQVDVSVDTLSAGGTAEVAVQLVNQNGDPVTAANTVNFTSSCVADGAATLESPVQTINGRAVSEYVANGCAGPDEIRATVEVGGSTLTAIGTIIVEQEAIGSIEFVSADPDQIALTGTGGDETSRVTFRVLGAAGAPIRDATVNFALNSTTGGLSLTQNSAVTNRDGLASTTVRAGSIATSVRVTATETSTGISTQSSQLVVSTGIPDMDSVSLSVLPPNPEGGDFDGVEVEVAIRAADAFNNIVPDGTAFSFYAEGGAIGPSCTTVNGECTVIWRSQDPRPDFNRVTILATAIGNESFTDANGNGRFDDGELFWDEEEAFADENENGQYDVGEFFIDFGPRSSPDGQHNGADGAYNGVLCADNNSTQCSSDRSLIVWDAGVIVMSTSQGTGVLTCDDTAYEPRDEIVVTTSATCELTVSDLNGNALPQDTSVLVSASSGLTVSGGTNFDIAVGTRPTTVSVTIQQTNQASPVNGTLTVTIETPKGIISAPFWNISNSP